MIELGEETILRYEKFTEWTDALREVPDVIWTRPIAEGKATVREIISHLIRWDQHIISTVIPAVKNGEGMAFPEFDPFNQLAYEYARSGISQDRLLDEFKQTRLQLVELLLAEPGVTAKPVASNGMSHCPDTGTPYSLLYVIHEFNYHDEHHRNQILRAI